MIKQKFVTLFLIGLIITGSIPGGHVLCLGADGHLALEPAEHDCSVHHDDCSHNESDHSQAFKQDSPDCKFCVDIPLSPTITLVAKRYNNIQFNTNASLPGAHLYATADNGASMTISGQSNNMTDQSLHALNTVILLT